MSRLKDLAYFHDAVVADEAYRRQEVAELTADIPLDRLREICAAERDGRVVVLPCKVGDKLYILTSDSLTGVEETKCRRIVIKTLQDGVVAKVIAPCTLDDWGGAFRELYVEDFGKTVFLTREAAENALKGASND